MKSKTIWLIVLCACVCLPGRSAAVERGPKIYVIQPETDRRVYLADLSVRTESGELLRAERTKMRTGPYGEPVLVRDVVDPSYGTLLLEARKHDITGRLRITYDANPYFWKQAFDSTEKVWKSDHDQGHWRPDAVYEWSLDPADEEQEQGRWTSVAYSEWKAAQVAQEERRVGEAQVSFLTDASEKLLDAVAGGAIDQQQSAKIKTALETLLATDLKAPLDPALSQAVTDAIEEAGGGLRQQIKALEQPGEASPPADSLLRAQGSQAPARSLRDLESRISQVNDLQADLEKALGNLIRQIRTGAPKPPQPRVMMERQYRVPVRHRGYCMPVTGGVILPPLVPAPPSP